ncbi:MAG: general secretion pathway protein GspD [Planctomycetota bacterium]|nr:MAG: general secretion pathway protein GspD [Planctomycetota bacterium]REJ98526.1 MAG: general secretion pathway protein GspD [Planctomycetota bacterium]REK29826.1 MAG: general secretion pathway protein GspD [Planctomycetota bacterium]REK48003.1 MAG: general secretion pathway protein GspD [Planctomycetota bacterium]
MKPTIKIIAVAGLSCWLLVGCVESILAAGWTAGVGSLYAVAQTPPAAEQDADGLLKMAREAIANGQFAVADSYVRRAEAKWSKFQINPFKDSPAKVRRDLREAESSKQQTPPSRSSRPLLTSPFGSRKEPPQADPFKNAGQNVDNLLEDKKGKAKNYLRRGREALARRDRVGAEHYAKLAIETGAQFGPNEDSPQRLWRELHGDRPMPTAGQAAIRQAPPQRAEVAGPQLTPDANSPAHAQARSTIGVEEAPPEQLPANTQLALPARRRPAAGPAPASAAASSGNSSQPQRAVYNPYSDDSRTIAAGGVVPDYPRTPYADTKIQLVAGVEPVDRAPATVSTAAAEASSSVPGPPTGQTASGPTSSQLIPSGQAPTTSTSGAAEPLRSTGVQLRQVPPQNAPAFVEPSRSSTSAGQPVTTPASGTMSPDELMQLGEEAMQAGNREVASRYFQEAVARANELDPVVAQRIQDRLVLSAKPRARGADRSQRLLQEASDAELRRRQQVHAEVQKQLRDAERQQESDPNAAMSALNETTRFIQDADVPEQDKRVLNNLVQMRLKRVKKYYEDHRSEIELAQTNRERRDNVERRKQHKVEVEERLAKLVNEFNQLVDEHRYEEAVLIGKKTRELAPNEAVATQVWLQARMLQRFMRNREIGELKEDGFVKAMIEADEASIPFDASRPMQYGDDWDAISESRSQFGDVERRRHPRELEIEASLRKPVALKFREAPLSEVVNYLQGLAGVNFYVDPVGLSEEGVHPSTPVTIDLQNEISLKSALDLILQPLHLSYVIENEVLKITSEQLRNSSVFTKMYNVADLVIPLPNFAPHNQLGLPQALDAGVSRTLGSLGGNAPPVMVHASPMGLSGGIDSPDALAQTIDPSGGFGTGARGGATNADFDPLIELITTTIEPDSWEEAGGAGRIAEFETNLSLVVSSTQEVHDKIRDLLEQLRRLQDLQVTIEVRFITLDDDFFERIGVDFNFNLDDKSPTFDPTADEQQNTSTVGFDGFDGVGGPPLFPETFDIQVRNGSFGGLIPGGFAGFDPTTAVGTTVGFAILSDIEAFFVVEASQSDSRSNILTAPKVTLFNGQAASISNQVQNPFVTSVVPVVGDFAAAQAPVIAVLPEGTTLSVQAVVSADRRYVRLTLIPFFSEIRDVEEFTFTGSSTSTSSESDETADAGDTTSASTATTTTTSGTTIQLPQFAFTTVTTTVSVPDGGTVLLGGVKSLNESRTERGTPFLAKIPYISRLFKNVGIGRETTSLMLMVTPRIIIQEEEEQNLGL